MAERVRITTLRGLLVPCRAVQESKLGQFRTLAPPQAPRRPKSVRTTWVATRSGPTGQDARLRVAVGFNSDTKRILAVSTRISKNVLATKIQELSDRGQSGLAAMFPAAGEECPEIGFIRVPERLKWRLLSVTLIPVLITVHGQTGALARHPAALEP